VMTETKFIIILTPMEVRSQLCDPVTCENVGDMEGKTEVTRYLGCREKLTEVII
jgi:hypothetical protein